MCLLSVLAAGLLSVFTQLNYPSDEWRHNYLHPQLCAATGDPAAFAIVAQAIFIFAFIFGENNIVKLRQGSGKVRQGKARKGKDGER